MSTSYPTIVTRFGYAPLAPAIWQIDEKSGLESRDLSLFQASEAALSGTHFRAAGQPHSGIILVEPSAQLAFVFVLKGSVTQYVGDGPALTLDRYASASRYGSGEAVCLDLSPDAELLVLQSTERGNAQLGEGGDGSWHVTHEGADHYVVGDGPRSFFRYRDLDVAKATQRRVHIHVVGATKPMDSGTGWHSHSMGQIFYVLEGWADLLVEHQPGVRMSAGDAMCVAKRMRHNVPRFSGDYLVLEMCVPADYDTMDAAA